MIFQKLTAADLEAEADRLLREDRQKDGSSYNEIDLLKLRDRYRKENRQYKIAERNQDAIEHQVSPEYRMNPEQLLVRDEEKALAKELLLQTLQHFEKDEPVKQVILAVLLFDIDFHRTRGLADATGMSPALTHAAKERLKYFAQSKALQAKNGSSKQ